MMAQEGGPQQFDSGELVHRYASCDADGEGILHLRCMGFEVAHVVQFLCQDFVKSPGRAGRCFPIVRSHCVDDVDGRHVLER
jgi:hypothetical protein